MTINLNTNSINFQGNIPNSYKIPNERRIYLHNLRGLLQQEIASYAKQESYNEKHAGRMWVIMHRGNLHLGELRYLALKGRQRTMKLGEILRKNLNEYVEKEMLDYGKHSVSFNKYQSQKRWAKDVAPQLIKDTKHKLYSNDESDYDRTRLVQENIKSGLIRMMKDYIAGQKVILEVNELSSEKAADEKILRKNFGDLVRPSIEKLKAKIIGGSIQK